MEKRYEVAIPGMGAMGTTTLYQLAKAWSHTLVVSANSGHGVKHSAALGEALAQWCARGSSEVDLSAFSLKR